MYLSRRIDDREIMLKRQQKIFFQISGAGHEALLVAAGMALSPATTGSSPTIATAPSASPSAVPPRIMFLQAVGAAADPASGGRQMPSHWTSPQLNIVTPSSSTATQCLHAVGCAEAGRYFATHPEAADRSARATTASSRTSHFHGDEVVYVSIGEGSTSRASSGRR